MEAVLAWWPALHPGRGGRSPTNHCILIMTDAYGVSPAIPSARPAHGKAAVRLSPLAADRARPVMSGRPARPAVGVELVTTHG